MIFDGYISLAEGTCIEIDKVEESNFKALRNLNEILLICISSLNFN